MKVLKRIKKIPWVKKIRHQVELIFLKLFMLLIWSGNSGGLIKGADFFGWLIFKVFRVRKRVVLENLRMAFPDKDEKELSEIAVRSYQNFAKMVIDFMRFPVMDKKSFPELYTFEGKKCFDWIRENGKGGVMVAGHFGSWELMGAALAQLGYPINFLVGEQHNKYVDDIMNANRELMDIKIIHMGVAVRGVIRALRNNEMVALLADQNAGRDGIFVNFFGRKASAHRGPAVFALKTRAPILFGSSIRLPNGKHKLIAELLTFDHLKGLTEENIREVTQAHISLLENAIRKYPDHWFWMHRRWKYRPPEERKKKKENKV